jgi:signal transduction histidine kinase
MIINSFSNNLNFSKKLWNEIQTEGIEINHLPFTLKIDRLKQISFLIISNPDELKEWQDYCARAGVAKTNLLYKFLIPLYVTNTPAEKLSDLNCLPLSSDMKTDEFSLVKFILKQKIDLFFHELESRVKKTKKFLLSVSPKIKWKNQVVLTSKDVSSLIANPSDNNILLSFGEVVILQKFWDSIKSEETDKYLYYFYNSEVYRIAKTDLKDEVVRKLILHYIFKVNHDQQSERQEYLEYILHFFDNVYNLAPFPIAIELSDRDLVWQNKTFSNLKLLPRSVKKMYNHEKIHSKHGFFIVYKHKFNFLDLEYNLVFMAQQSEKFSNASEDLGIMTSSLAHEMNNPLSAIKAAIEVIGIMDKNIKNKDTLDQMLVSVNRCLQLVKIFLGFTKASYQLDSSKMLAADIIPFRDCWEYAVQLLRTRLVSASIKLHFDWNVKKDFSVGNSNILTMMLYWLLSQFVNIVERKLLISRNMALDQKIKIIEDKSIVSLVFEVPIKEISSTIEQSLLMNHLLELENLNLVSEQENQINILRNN